MLRPTETPRGNPVNPHCALIFCAFNRRKNNSLLDWMDMWRTLVEGRCKNMFWDQNVTINYCASSQIPKGEKIGRRSFKETKQRFCSEGSHVVAIRGQRYLEGLTRNVSETRSSLTSNQRAATTTDVSVSAWRSSSGAGLISSHLRDVYPRG